MRSFALYPRPMEPRRGQYLGDQPACISCSLNRAPNQESRATTHDAQTHPRVPYRHGRGGQARGSSGLEMPAREALRRPAGLSLPRAGLPDRSWLQGRPSSCSLLLLPQTFPKCPQTFLLPPSSPGADQMEPTLNFFWSPPK